MPRCVRASFRHCGVQDLNRGYADGHLCECDTLVPTGVLLDGRPRGLSGWERWHGSNHRCGECGRLFTLQPPVDMTGLPGTI